MPRLIEEDKAKEVLIDYYHIRTDIQLMSMEEAFSRVPTVETSGIFNKGLLAGLKAAGKNAIPIEWIKRYIAEEGIYPNRELLSVEQADAIERMVENWEKENANTN